jgi:primosomal protein N' (replication factor Y) (superfamily II helicase)
VIGPAPCFVERIRERHRWQLVLRGASPSSLLESGDLPRGWQVDVDPVSLL